MTRPTLALALAVALSATVFAAAPAAPVLAQTISANETRNVTGSTWSGPAAWAGGESKVWTLMFRDDGVLVYGYEGNTYDNGRWIQRENLVVFETNGYFAIYSGVLDANGRTYSGTMHNVRGDEGRFEFRLNQ